MIRVKLIYNPDAGSVNTFLKNISRKNIISITYHQGTSAYNTDNYYPVCFIVYDDEGSHSHDSVEVNEN
uniref:ORF49 n=1 Tax=Nitrosopumilaceae spindle-shaped virus TaxID=3065433 RepID=A0AAT9J7N3_9VIRU